MTRLERLARLRVRLATIERTRANAHVGRLAARAAQVAVLIEGYTPDSGAARGVTLAARAAFADRLGRSGDALAIEARAARATALDAERDVHRAQKTAAEVTQGAAADRLRAGKRRVRPARGDLS